MLISLLFSICLFNVNFIEEDPSFQDLIYECPVERLATGFHFVEGPAWNSSERALYFSDIPANTIYRWTEENGVSKFLYPSGYTGSVPFRGNKPGSNGLTFDFTGRLILAEHGDRRITRLEKNGTKTVLADSYEGKRFNSPNDVISDRVGNIFFTDPPFGLPNGFEDKAKELSFQGIYKITPSGEISLLTQEVKVPNGLGISPDGKTFYVSNSDPELPVWYAFDFDKNRLTNKRIFANASKWQEGREGQPDGFCIDQSGNLFAAGPEGLYVISPQGKILGVVDFGHKVSNCTWGDDGSSLYITANDSIYRMRVKTIGF